ncbi:hypothetical protein [Muribaculum intestinale]|uniref:hypothetical protein n=1 Tax=Muribaculum intestinale TaxID=1796646 RepID=UPI002432015B|nr:hypothetical protein [Muribaculum intestinale]
MKCTITQLILASMLGSGIAAAQTAELPDYYVIAKNSQENTISNGSQDGNGRSWWAYGAFNRDMSFSLEKCCVEDAVIEFDLYVESPLAKDGMVFSGIEWGCPLDDGNGKMENQNYINLNLKSSGADWTFVSMGPGMNTVYADIFGGVVDGQWNHVVIPMSKSPNLDKLNADTQFTGVSLQFARMKSADYIFKMKNMKIVDHGRVVVNESIATRYKYKQPNSSTKECQFVLGGDPKTSAYITLEIDHVDLSGYTNTAFNFEVEITPVDGVEDPALLENITGKGGQGVILASKPSEEIKDWGQEAAGYYNIKKLDWKFGKHVYSVATSSMNNLDKVDWSDIVTCRMYIYNDVTTLGKINVKFTDFYFTGDIVRDYDDGDDTVGIEDTFIDAESEVTVYNLNGIRVYCGVLSEAVLPHGIYVVVSGRKVSKIIL